MAAGLVDGRKYALVSNCGASSVTGIGNKSIYHVKLTDAVAKSIEEFRRSKVCHVFN